MTEASSGNEARSRYARARRPAEKAARREDILAAAARMLDRSRTHDISLNGIAQEVGLSKPNLYRYFESREEILLELFLSDLRSFSADVVAGLSMAESDAVVAPDAASAVLVEAYVARPRLCRFLGMIASVYEYNVSARVIEATKIEAIALATTVADALHGALPSLTPERCLWLNNMTALLVAGLWPPAHPAPAVLEVLSKPEFQIFRPDFRRDLESAIVALIRGSSSSNLSGSKIGVLL